MKLRSFLREFSDCYCDLVDFVDSDDRLFAEHWLESLAATARLPETACEWRTIRVNVSQQLAKRLDTFFAFNGMSEHSRAEFSQISNLGQMWKGDQSWREWS